MSLAKIPVYRLIVDFIRADLDVIDKVVAHLGTDVIDEDGRAKKVNGQTPHDIGASALDRLFKLFSFMAITLSPAPTISMALSLDSQSPPPFANPITLTIDVAQLLFTSTQRLLTFAVSVGRAKLITSPKLMSRLLVTCREGLDIAHSILMRFQTQVFGRKTSSRPNTGGAPQQATTLPDLFSSFHSLCFSVSQLTALCATVCTAHTVEQLPAFLARRLHREGLKLLKAATAHPLTCLLAIFELPEHARHELRQAATTYASCQQMDTSVSDKSIAISPTSAIRLIASVAGTEFALKRATTSLISFIDTEGCDTVPYGCRDDLLFALSNAQLVSSITKDILKHTPHPLGTALSVALDDSTVQKLLHSKLSSEDEEYLYTDLEPSSSPAPAPAPASSVTPTDPYSTCLPGLQKALSECLEVLIRVLESPKHIHWEDTENMTKQCIESLAAVVDVRNSIKATQITPPPLLVNLNVFLPDEFRGYASHSNEVEKTETMSNGMRYLALGGNMSMNEVSDGTEADLIHTDGKLALYDSHCTESRLNELANQWLGTVEFERIDVSQDPTQKWVTDAFALRDKVGVSNQAGPLSLGSVSALLSPPPTVESPVTGSSAGGGAARPSSDVPSAGQRIGGAQGPRPTPAPRPSRPSHWEEPAVPDHFRSRRVASVSSRMPSRHVDDFEQTQQTQQTQQQVPHTNLTPPSVQVKPTVNVPTDETPSTEPPANAPTPSAGAIASLQDPRSDLNRIPGWADFVAAGRADNMDVMQVLQSPQLLRSAEVKVRFLKLLERHALIKDIFASLGVQF
eukprot:GHVO01039267.1.p1 GENE.GHVO01039267.1~~GHVO01039267.1.p1  ORF type:complete len:873 (+),score=180.84 GHVO01039267.1:224-2620(+)